MERLTLVWKCIDFVVFIPRWELTDARYFVAWCVERIDVNRDFRSEDARAQIAHRFQHVNVGIGVVQAAGVGDVDEVIAGQGGSDQTGNQLTIALIVSGDVDIDRKSVV